MDSNRLQMDRMLSSQQIRAARSLLGWSRRELAIVAGISQGTIKAIEQGTTDVRLSTLRKLAQTFTAHDIKFVAEGDWTGVAIKKQADAVQASRTSCIAEHTQRLSEAERDDAASAKTGPFQWLRPLMRTARGQTG